MFKKHLPSPFGKSSEWKWPSKSLPFLLATTLGFLSTHCSKPPTKLFNVYSEDQGAGSGDLQPAEPTPGPDPAPVPVNNPDPMPSPTPTPGTPAPMPGTPTPVTPMPTPMPVTPTPMPVTPMPVPTPQPAIEECANKLSVGRIYQWIATTEGQMVPSSGSIVVKEGNQNVARVKFIGNEWHVLPVWLKNVFDAEVDLSASKGFTLTYSATADLYLQLRPSFAWDGGAKHLVKIPSTGGQSKSLTVDFKESSWTFLDSLGKPPHPLAMAVKQARGFVFVGNVPNEFAVTGLAIDGYAPPCP